MVKNYEKRGSREKHIKADVIVLGCTLPGMVAAHKLKKRFGDSMEIVVLDLATTMQSHTRLNVAFQEQDPEEDEEYRQTDPLSQEFTIYDNMARHYIAKFSKEFNIPLPDAIISPTKLRSPLLKLFQFTNGNTVPCPKDYHDFEYLNYLEKFELEQYQNLLNQNMRNLFHSKEDSEDERKRLLFFDQTTMETHLTQVLMCSTSKDVMRAIVNLVCGVPADKVSVLFYLHQCYRTNGSKNHVDGDNPRFREKLIGYCRKRLSNNLQKSISNITFITKPIREIRTCSDEQVILKTMLGEQNYVCNLLAMALRPEELRHIQFEDNLLSESNLKAAKAMTPGHAKKFSIQYKDNFWKRDGYSGDILSIRGPIIWAMERPETSTTGSVEKYASLIGYLKVNNKGDYSRDAVIDQLVSLFGEQAATPVSYKETNTVDVYIPRCGDYVALRKLTFEVNPKYIIWGAFDIFAEGDLAAALEAGHTAYLHLLNILRPQAQTFDDMAATEHPTRLPPGPVETYVSSLNMLSIIKIALVGCTFIVGVHLIRAMRR